MRVASSPSCSSRTADPTPDRTCREARPRPWIERSRGSKCRTTIEHQRAARELLEVARRCTATKDFDVYAIPSGYEDGTKDVFAHGVPRHAKHIQVRFVYTADGHPVKATPFPLQTWTARVKGFRSDGLLWVRIKLVGLRLRHARREGQALARDRLVRLLNGGPAIAEAAVLEKPGLQRG